MFEKLFNILKQKENNNVKIILTTPSDDITAALIKEIAAGTLGEGFITTDKQLTWGDLTASSQTALLEKTVIFQGREVALNQLTSAEAMTKSFPVAHLLQKKELTIGEDPVLSSSSGYNKKYYMNRTINQNIVIKQDITRDKKLNKFSDLLASTEEQFKQLCQQNPMSNVHWLVEDKSGELVWNQSQGNFQTLRKYIDDEKSQSYSPSYSENIMQRENHHRFMLVADTAGMGKTTLLTHLSEQIKEKFPTHWLVRIYLNYYTKLFEEQKGKEIDKAWVIEFVSNKVLKLERNLEKELFKKSFEGNGVNKLVVMLNGFDEICPNYKETVIDMMQILKQTSLEQLWVTTRPHLKDDLEDILQQISYTLQPFSEGEQVQFLEKFWTKHLDLEVKDQRGLKRLRIYAKALIRKLAQSISDKDRAFTGIPLQTRMIAEDFGEEFRAFYWSKESDPELPQKLDLLGLYKTFVDRKYDIYYGVKATQTAGKVAAEDARDRDRKFIKKQHQLLALEALLPEDILTFLQINDMSELNDEQLARIGIAQRNKEGKPHFIHRTFAEFHVAEFLINELQRKTKSKQTVQKFLLNKGLLQPEYRVIRAFLDGFLGESTLSAEVVEDYGKELHEQWKAIKGQGPLIGVTTALFQAASEDNANIIGFIVDSLKSAGCFNTVTEMMLAKNDKGRNISYIAGANDSLRALDKIWEWVKEVAPTPESSLRLSHNRKRKHPGSSPQKEGT
jgi:hypothetical protein